MIRVEVAVKKDFESIFWHFVKILFVCCPYAAYVEEPFCVFDKLTKFLGLTRYNVENPSVKASMKVGTFVLNVHNRQL